MEGQEITQTPSAEYIAAAKEVQEWIKSISKGTSRVLGNP